MKSNLTIEDIKTGILITTNTLFNNIKRTLPKKSLELSQVNNFRLRVKDIVDQMQELETDELSDIDLKQDIFEIISEYINLKKELKFILDERYQAFNLNNLVIESLYIHYLIIILED